MHFIYQFTHFSIYLQLNTTTLQKTSQLALVKLCEELHSIVNDLEEYAFTFTLNKKQAFYACLNCILISKIISASAPFC